MPDNVTQWLSKKEYMLYEIAAGSPVRAIDKERMATLESLAACRRLMEKYEWIKTDTGFQCLECEVVWHSDKILEHAPDCAWAKCIEGLPRKGK